MAGAGNDKFVQTPTSYNFTPKDFDKDYDKIYLFNGYGVNGTTIKTKYDNDKKMTYISVTSGSLINAYKKIYMPEFGFDEVKRWVRDARTNLTKPPLEQLKTPIII